MSKQLKFGEITRAEAEKQAGIVHQDNPLIATFGRDPMGRGCKYCAHLYRKDRFFKCDLRPETNGPGSDHRQNWPACGKYERKVGT